MSDASFTLRTRGRRVSLPFPAVMGAINVSPESFYQVRIGVDAVVDCAAKMIADGVSIIDVGAEATSPGLTLLDNEDQQINVELERLSKVVEALRSRFDVLLSIDTSRATVIHAMADLGVDMINDQRALTLPRALEAVAEHGLAACIMHSFRPQRKPGSSSPTELMDAICSDLSARLKLCHEAGMHPEQLMVDPGFGQGLYGKNVEENFYLLAHLARMKELGAPILVGWSRKSQLRDLLSRHVEECLAGSLAAATLAGYLGASIIRAHDVQETVDVCRVVGYLTRLTSPCLSGGSPSCGT